MIFNDVLLATNPRIRDHSTDEMECWNQRKESRREIPDWAAKWVMHLYLIGFMKKNRWI